MIRQRKVQLGPAVAALLGLILGFGALTAYAQGGANVLGLQRAILKAKA